MTTRKAVVSPAAYDALVLEKEKYRTLNDGRVARINQLLAGEEAQGRRIDELLRSNNELVKRNRDLKRRVERADEDVVALATELARSRREIHIMQQINTGKRFTLRRPDQDTTGGFDIVGDQFTLRRPDQDTTGGFDVVGDQPQRAGGTRQCFP